MGEVNTRKGRWVTVGVAHRMLRPINISRKTVQRLIESGVLAAVQDSPRSWWRIDVSSIEAYRTRYERGHN